MDADNIFFMGKDTSGEAVEEFVKRVMHASPRQLQLGDHSLAFLASLSQAVRQYDKQISAIILNIEASKACLHEEVGEDKTCDTDELVVAMQASVDDMVKEEKEKVFRSVAGATTETQNLVYGRAGVSLSIKLKQFIEDTNKLLSWDVTDPSVKQNQYKACNHCREVYMLAEGCEDETVCGERPSGERFAQRPPILHVWKSSDGGRRIVETHINGVQYAGKALRNMIKSLRDRVFASTVGSEQNEVGCGADIAWKSMLPLSSEQMQIIASAWGEVPLVDPGSVEHVAGQMFRAQVRMAVIVAKDDLQREKRKLESDASLPNTRQRMQHEESEKTCNNDAQTAPPPIPQRSLMEKVAAIKGALNIATENMAEDLETACKALGINRGTLNLSQQADECLKQIGI
jgi:hypothetical protein